MPDRPVARHVPRRPDRGADWRATEAELTEDAAARARARARPVFRNVADYEAAHPEGARYLWSARRQRPVVLVPLLHDHRWGGLPGGYLLAAAVEGTDGSHWVGVYDHDDGEWRRSCPSAEAARAVLEELAGLGPLDPPDLVDALGFQPD